MKPEIAMCYVPEVLTMPGDSNCRRGHSSDNLATCVNLGDGPAVMIQAFPPAMQPVIFVHIQKTGGMSLATMYMPVHPRAGLSGQRHATFGGATVDRDAEAL